MYISLVFNFISTLSISLLCHYIECFSLIQWLPTFLITSANLLCPCSTVITTLLWSNFNNLVTCLHLSTCLLPKGKLDCLYRCNNHSPWYLCFAFHIKAWRLQIWLHTFGYDNGFMICLPQSFSIRKCKYRLTISTLRSIKFS